MRATVVTLADTARRGSLLPRDFLYEPGETVSLRDGDRVVVVSQTARALLVSRIEFVPGSTVAFCCSLPEPLTVFDVELRKDARR